MKKLGAGTHFEVEEVVHVVRGDVLQEGQISTLSDLEKFYMASALLDAMNAMALSVSLSEFCIFWPFFSMEVEP